MSGVGQSNVTSVALISLQALEQRLAELTEDMGRLAHIFEQESERSSTYSIVTGCLECLLVDRLRPAGEALARLTLEMGNDSPGEPRESSWPA